jgi:Xaa-Pro aminopeptidase
VSATGAGAPAERRSRLAATLEQPLLVTRGVNVVYLTGFESSNAALRLDPDGAATLYTDFRYLEAAQTLDGVEVTPVRRALVGELAELLRGAVAFEASHLSVADAETLRAGGVELVPTHGVVEALRALKDAGEIAAIRRAAAAADRAFEALTAETWIGHSESELAWRLRQLLHAHGADELSFETLIATGANGSRPHHHPGAALLEPRSLVIADFGARLDGYCSDCTRTMHTGGLPDELARIYAVCLEAQQAAVAGIRPGMSGAEADSLAREVISAAGYGAEFGHGLGHGVGLEVHELPRLRPESTDRLSPGQVVTVEPGIYLPGVGGVRIEDLAVVRDGGLEVLSSFPKELIGVG